MSEFTIMRETLRTFDPLVDLTDLSDRELGGWMADIIGEETGLDTGRDFSAEDIAAAKVDIHVAGGEFSESQLSVVRQRLASKVRLARR